MRTSRALLIAAVTAAALTAANPASAVLCIPPTGASLSFNPLNPTSANQLINNVGQEGGGAFTCTIQVGVNNASPLTLIAANISDVTASVVVGNQITFDVLQGMTLLLDNAVAGLSQQIYDLGPTVAAIPISIVQSGTFENLGFNASFSSQFTLAAVPGPIVGAGLPGLIVACGALILLARRRRQRLA